MHNEFLDFENLFLVKIKQLLLLRFIDRNLLIIPIFTTRKQKHSQ